MLIIKSMLSLGSVTRSIYADIIQKGVLQLISMDKRYKHFQSDLIGQANLISSSELMGIYKPENINHRIRCFRTGLLAFNKTKEYLQDGVDYNQELLKNNKILDLYEKDMITYTTLSTIAPYYRQPQNERKVYVVCKDFLDTFLTANFSLVQYRHLLRNACGYIKLPYPVTDHTGHSFSGFFFYVGPKHQIQNSKFKADIYRPYPTTDEVVIFAYITDDFLHSTFHCLPFPVDETLSIENNYKEVTFALGKEMPSLSVDNQITVKNDYHSGHKLMHNLLVYLNTGKPDLRGFINPIKYQSPTSTKLTRDSKELSRSDIVEVGFSYLKDRLQHTDSWTSKPHMGWRWCGPKRSQIEWVPISGSVKSWKAKEDV